jgi:hypothetical protein
VYIGTIWTPFSLTLTIPNVLPEQHCLFLLNIFQLNPLTLTRCRSSTVCTSEQYGHPSA